MLCPQIFREKKYKKKLLKKSSTLSDSDFDFEQQQQQFTDGWNAGDWSSYCNLQFLHIYIFFFAFLGRPILGSFQASCTVMDGDR